MKRYRVFCTSYRPHEWSFDISATDNKEAMQIALRYYEEEKDAHAILDRERTIVDGVVELVEMKDDARTTAHV